MAKTFQVEKIIEKIQPALDERAARQTELDNLTAKHQETQKAIGTLETEILDLILKTDEILKKGGSIDALDKKIYGLKTQKDTAEKRLARLETDLIPKAKAALEAAIQTLATQVKVEMQPFIRGCADTMSRQFAAGMNYFDEFIETSDAFYKELGVSLQAGTHELAPIADEPRLWALLESGFIRSPKR